MHKITKLLNTIRRIKIDLISQAMNLHVLLGDVATPPKHFGQGFSKSPSTRPEVLILHTRSTQAVVHCKEILLLTVFWNITLFHICFLLSAHVYDGRVKFKSALWNIFFLKKPCLRRSGHFNKKK